MKEIYICPVCGIRVDSVDLYYFIADELVCWDCYDWLQCHRMMAMVNLI